MSAPSVHDDWLSLIEISGPFLAVPVLKEAFPQGLEELDATKRKRLRQAYEEWREALEDGRSEHNETALLALDQEIAAEQQNLFAELSQAFATQQTEQAGQLVRQGRFLNKLRQEIQAALP